MYEASHVQVTRGKQAQLRTLIAGRASALGQVRMRKRPLHLWLKKTTQLGFEGGLFDLQHPVDVENSRIVVRMQ